MFCFLPFLLYFLANDLIYSLLLPPFTFVFLSVCLSFFLHFIFSPFFTFNSTGLIHLYYSSPVSKRGDALLYSWLNCHCVVWIFFSHFLNLDAELQEASFVTEGFHSSISRPGSSRGFRVHRIPSDVISIPLILFFYRSIYLLIHVSFYILLSLCCNSFRVGSVLETVGESLENPRAWDPRQLE